MKTAIRLLGALALVAFVATVGCSDSNDNLPGSTTARDDSAATTPAPTDDVADVTPDPAPASNASIRVDEALPAYAAVSGVSGSLKSVGSDTMTNEMTFWTEGFTKFYPAVQIEVEGHGSSTAPPKLIEGASQLGPMSRPMKSDEVDDFKEAFGYEPTALRTSVDILAVYVHKDNPIAERGMTLPEVDAIFSKNRKGGHESDIRTWGDLGLTGPWATKPIAVYGRNAASGTYGYFKKHALYGGDFKDSVKEQPGSSAVVQAIANDRFAIGYSGIGYKTADVVAVPLAVAVGEEPADPTPENAYQGFYPLGRFLLIYINKKPGEPLSPLLREFVRFIYSREGQEAVVKAGYLPLDSVAAAAMLDELEMAAY